MSENTRTVRLTIDVTYECGPLGFVRTDKLRLIEAARAGIERAGAATEVLTANAVVTAGGPVVGRQYTSWDGHTYRCDSYDPSIGFWMTDIADPQNRRNVSERAIGNSFHIDRKANKEPTT